VYHTKHDSSTTIEVVGAVVALLGSLVLAASLGVRMVSKDTYTFDELGESSGGVNGDMDDINQSFSDEIEKAGGRLATDRPLFAANPFQVMAKKHNKAHVTEEQPASTCTSSRYRSAVCGYLAGFLCGGATIVDGEGVGTLGPFPYTASSVLITLCFSWVVALLFGLCQGESGVGCVSAWEGSKLRLCITAVLFYGATMLEHFLLATVPMRYGCIGQMAAVPVAIVLGWWWGEPMNQIKTAGCAVVLGGMAMCLIGSTVVAGEGADSDADADDGVDISAGASAGADSSSYEDYYYAYSYQ